MDASYFLKINMCQKREQMSNYAELSTLNQTRKIADIEKHETKQKRLSSLIINFKTIQASMTFC